MSLRVLTFNVFFDTTARRLRSRALLEIARSSAAHVLLFQEVTRPFLRELAATDWVVRDFACSDADYTGALSWLDWSEHGQLLQVPASFAPAPCGVWC